MKWSSYIKNIIYIAGMVFTVSLVFSSCSIFINDGPGYGAIIGDPKEFIHIKQCKPGQRFNCWRKL